MNAFFSQFFMYSSITAISSPSELLTHLLNHVFHPICLRFFDLALERFFEIVRHIYLVVRFSAKFLRFFGLFSFAFV